MTALDLRTETTAHPAAIGAMTPSRQLASALVHVLNRDEGLPPRWRADVFVTAVADHRARIATIERIAELDPLAPVAADTTFRGAVTALASDPMAAALAVRRLEILRGSPLPAWPVIVRHGVAPRVTHAEQERWFG